MATRKSHGVQFKAKVALDAIREQKTINALTTEYGIHAMKLPKLFYERSLPNVR